MTDEQLTLCTCPRRRCDRCGDDACRCRRWPYVQLEPGALIEVAPRGRRPLLACADCRRYLAALGYRVIA